MAEGRVADACAKFEESNRIDPATGTLLNLAVCNESRGKTATAWAQFRSAEAAATLDGRADRVEFARARRAQLAAKLAYLTIVVPAARQPQGLRVQLDGAPISASGWNVALPVDPGMHIVLVNASGVGQHSFTAQLGPGDVDSVVIDVGSMASAELEREAPSSVVVQRGSPESTADAPSNPLRTLAFVWGGLGAASLGAGVFFGARAFSQWDERNRRCPMDVCATAAGQRAQHSAEAAARNANIAVGVGLVGVAAGVGLYLLGGQPEPAPESVGWRWAPQVAKEQLGIAAEGHW
jgi:hypothetical protein